MKQVKVKPYFEISRRVSSLCFFVFVIFVTNELLTEKGKIYGDLAKAGSLFKGLKSALNEEGRGDIPPAFFSSFFMFAVSRTLTNGWSDRDWLPLSALLAPRLQPGLPKHPQAGPRFGPPFTARASCARYPYLKVRNALRFFMVYHPLLKNLFFPETMKKNETD